MAKGCIWTHGVNGHCSFKNSLTDHRENILKTKETAFAEAIKTPKKFTDKLWKGVGEELYMNSESVGGFLDTVSKNLDDFL